MTDTADIDLIRAELDALRAELAELREVQAADAPPPIVIESVVTRRNWMKAAAAAAVGGTAVALSGSQPAAAASAYTLGLTSNFDPTRTQATHTGTDGAVSFLFTSASPKSDSLGGTANYLAVLGGWSYSASRPNGIYGFSNASSGNANGVVGLANSPQGAGVLGQGGAVAGTGVRGLGGSSGNGVEGSGKNGVSATGTEYGLVTTGTAAAIYIPPANAVAPADRGTTDSPGALETNRTDDSLGSSNLWFCTDGGVGGGTWRKLAGPETAGSFHAISPIRAYDSRRAAPAPGRLAAGANRVVSIKDGRDQLTGAVNFANAIPNRATAVTYNLTIDGTLSYGFLSVTPGDAASTNTSAINWSASNQTVANAGAVALNFTRQIKVFCGSGDPAASTNFIIDITGYYL